MEGAGARSAEEREVGRSDDVPRARAPATRTLGRGGRNQFSDRAFGGILQARPLARGQTKRPGTRRPGRRENEMLSWKGTVVKLLALAAFIASFAGEAEGWTW